MERRVICLFGLLFLSSAIAELAYFQGRSSNVVYSPSNIQDDSFLFLIDKYSASTTEQITETNVADLISYLLGTPILNTKAPREHFPQGNIFEKDRANLLIVIDGVGSETLKSIPQLKVLQQSGKQFKIVKEFFPQDNIASLTTLLTGYGPSVHGVVNKTWFSEGRLIRSFSGVESAPQVATLADVVSQTFGGKSLIVSGSVSGQLSSALSVNKFANSHLTTNTYTYHWCEKSSAFKNACGNVMNGIPSSRQSVLESISNRAFPLRNKGDKIEFSSQQIAVTLSGDNIAVTFDLNDDRDFSFFAEMELIQSIATSLMNADIKSLVDDSIPDMFSFAISSIKGLQNKYGKDSQHVKAALLVLDGVLAKTIVDMKAIYGRLAVELAFMGVPAYTRIQESPVYSQFKSDVYTAIKSVVPNKGTFPIVYTPNAEKTCDILRSQGFSSFQDLDLQCKLSYSVKVGAKRAEVLGDEVNTYPDYARFQIVLWASVLLGLTAIAVVYALYASGETGQVDNFLRGPSMKAR